MCIFSNFTVRDEILEFVTDAHRDDERRPLAIGPVHAAFPERRQHLRRRVSANDERQFGIMHRDSGIRRHLARGGAKEQIAAGRIAHRMIGRDRAFELAAAILDLEAGVVDLRSGRASGDDRAPDPRHRLPASQQPADRVGRFDGTARRMEVDRAPGVLHVAQEWADARGGSRVDDAFHGDPAVAARSA